MDIVESARVMTGIPFRHQGRTFSGVDCVGLIVLTLRSLGITSHDCTSYGRRPDGVAFMREFYAAGAKRVRVCDRMPGHLIVVPETRRPCHIGVLTERGGIIHAHAPDRCVVETGLPADWLMKAHACLAWPEVDYG